MSHPGFADLCSAPRATSSLGRAACERKALSPPSDQLEDAYFVRPRAMLRGARSPVRHLDLGDFMLYGSIGVGLAPWFW